MAKKGGQPGNTNGTKNREWADAIRRALARYSNDKIKQGAALNAIADTVIERAILGDKDAWVEIGNRLDGKPVQAIAGDTEDGALIVKVMKCA